MWSGFVGGQGLTFNDNEYVEGFTSLVWTLLVSLAARITGLKVHVVSVVLNYLTIVLTAVATSRMLRVLNVLERDEDGRRRPDGDVSALLPRRLHRTGVRPTRSCWSASSGRCSLRLLTHRSHPHARRSSQAAAPARWPARGPRAWCSRRSCVP